MKKSIYSIGISLMMLVIMFLYTACSCTFGYCTIVFETWGGSGFNNKTFDPGDSINSSDVPAMVTKPCYNFLYWCYDKELTQPLEFPMVAGTVGVTYYAKYELDLNYISEYNIKTINWMPEQESMYIDVTTTTAYSYVHIFINKTDTTQEFDSIIITPINATIGQEVDISTVFLYDEQGKTTDDGNSDYKVFTPVGEKSQNAFQAVLRINIGLRAGDFRVTIS